MKINRRKFITNTSLTATGLIAGSSLSACFSGGEETMASYDVMKEVLKYRKFDAHVHPADDTEIGRASCRERV